MRILIVHNRYGSAAPSGENEVFDLERALLRERGHEVRAFTRESDEIRSAGFRGLVKGALSTPWNPYAAAAVRQAAVEFAPDIVHVHNTFPLLSPAIFPALHRRVARVLTLHNYRLFCPAAIPLRDGRPCTLCLDRRSVVPAMRYGCYRGSRIATVPLAASVALHRLLGTWEHHVDAFIVLSEFQRALMVKAGLPARRVWVKPNFYPGAPVSLPWRQRRDCVVFAGRLSEEKGVGDLIDAWLAWGATAPELRIVGDGPLRRELQVRAERHPRIVFLGQVDAASAQREIGSAKLLVLPSVCFEGFPMVVREAFAFGTPAAVSNIGPLPHIVEHGRNGVVFPPGNPVALAGEVRRAWEQGQIESMGHCARKEFEDKYSEDANYRQLVSIYGEAVASFRERLDRAGYAH